jgi:hypothetical protein
MRRKFAMHHTVRNLALLLAALAVFSALQPVLADPPIASEVWVTCKPVESMIYLGNRYHVKCDKGWTNPQTSHKYPYFAIAATSSAQVEQAMSTVHTALITGKLLRILIKTGSSYNPPGCLTDDCRPFIAIGVLN